MAPVRGPVGGRGGWARRCILSTGPAAPHGPFPLLAQIADRYPGVFAVEYLERGPETWRLRLGHR
ncbi:DUF2249 domain-containing protein [Streptomyces sp. NPDC102394]|uniref:DUF2249 domain-containing protein n=1 Tax=Streptomyces sp. NPDC102394 TaxID=3366167 RepID=UPI0037FB4128